MKIKKVEKVKVGDQLMGDDSTPRNVLSLARGQEEMYWVRQNKGLDYRVNKSHILSLKRSRNEGNHKHGDILNIEVSDYIEKSDKFRSNYKGYKVSVEYADKKIEVDPYFLGLWLGDGRSSDIRIATQDKEVVQYLETYAQKLDKKLHVYKAEGKCPVYGITNVQEEGNPKNLKDSLQAKLREINLIENKHIPQDYIANSREKRLELLAGLIDSDGYYDDEYHVMEIVQKRESLAKEIKFLADSLGFRVSLKAKKASIKSIEYECEVYRVRIVGDLDMIPTKIERKKARPLMSKRDHQHTGITVEYDKVDDYYGFTIAAEKKEDHLFILADGYELPALIVEVISPETRSKDMIKKLALYMNTGIKEYWVVDTDSSMVMVHSFEDYDLKGTKIFVINQVIESQLLKAIKIEMNDIIQ